MAGERSHRGLLIGRQKMNPQLMTGSAPAYARPVAGCATVSATRLRVVRSESVGRPHVDYPRQSMRTHLADSAYPRGRPGFGELHCRRSISW